MHRPTAPQDLSDLLDWLAAQCGCDCLSDLRAIWAKDQLKNVLSTAHIPAFSPRMWRDAAAYVTGRPCAGDDIEAIRREFISRL